MWQKLNPLRTLRVRVGLLVLGVIAALAVFTTQYFSERLTDSYREAGRAQLGAIASLWDDSFRLRQLANPQGTSGGSTPCARRTRRFTSCLSPGTTSVEGRGSSRAVTSTTPMGPSRT